MFEFIDRRSDTPTPPLIKLSVIIQAFFLIQAFFQLVSMSHTARSSQLAIGLTVITIIFYILALIAFWNLRRWSVIFLLVLTLIPLFLILQLPNVRTIPIIAGFFIRGLLLIPGFIYWKVMKL